MGATMMPQHGLYLVQAYIDDNVDNSDNGIENLIAIKRSPKFDPNVPRPNVVVATQKLGDYDEESFFDPGKLEFVDSFEDEQAVVVSDENEDSGLNLHLSSDEAEVVATDNETGEPMGKEELLYIYSEN